MSTRQLMRKSDSMFLGVAAGIADYFNIDPMFARLAFVAFTLAGGHGIIAYAVLALVMPKDEFVGTIDNSFEEEIVIQDA